MEAHKRTMKRSLILLHISVFIMSATPLFAKLITLSPLDTIALRCLIAAPVLLLFIRLTGLRLVVHRTDLGWLLALGLLMAFHWVSFFATIQMAGVAVGLTAFYSYTIMTVLMEPFFHRASVDRRDLAVSLMVVAGIYLAVPGGIGGGRIALGALFGVCSAFSYALRNILYRRYLTSYPPSAMMFYQIAVAGVVPLPFLSSGIDLQADHRWAYLILLGVIFTAFTHTLFVGCLRTISASTAGLITSLEPIYGMIFAAAILSEVPGLRTVVGAMMVVVVSVYTSIRTGRSIQ